MEVGLDITERKQAEAAVQAERRRLFDVLETLPPMVCLLTLDYHVAFANRSFREKFGESHGRHCYEYCFGRTAAVRILRKLYRAENRPAPPLGSERHGWQCNCRLRLPVY